MAKPVLTDSAERLYNQLAPTFFPTDAVYDWPGAKYIAALSVMRDDAATAVQPTTTLPAFAALFDVNNVPAKWLPWLAQFVGVDLTTSPSTAVSRQWIQHPLGYNRGTDAAMRLAAEATLTGIKTVYFYHPSPFKLKVATNESETPNPTATKLAILELIPAWMVLEYVVVKAGTYAQLEAAHAKYSESEAAHATYEGAELEPSK